MPLEVNFQILVLFSICFMGRICLLSYWNFSSSLRAKWAPDRDLQGDMSMTQATDQGLCFSVPSWSQHLFSHSWNGTVCRSQFVTRAPWKLGGWFVRYLSVLILWNACCHNRQHVWGLALNSRAILVFSFTFFLYFSLIHNHVLL